MYNISSFSSFTSTKRSVECSDDGTRSHDEHHYVKQKLRDTIKPRPLPLYYIMEQKTSKIFPDTSLETLLLRMESLMVRWSLQLNMIQDENQIFLTTFGTRISLVVCFWELEVKDINNNNKRTIAVEIQSNLKHYSPISNTDNRLHFLFFAKRILTCLGNEQQLQQGEETRTSTSTAFRSGTASVTAGPLASDEISQLIHMHKDEATPQTRKDNSTKLGCFLKEETIIALEKIDCHLKNELTFAVGMETLDIMTDPNKVGIEVALFTSQVILLGATECEKNGSGNMDIALRKGRGDTFTRLAETVLRLAVCENTQGLSPVFDPLVKEVSPYEASTNSSCAYSNYMALCIIVNAMRMVAEFSDSYSRNTKQNGSSICNISTMLLSNFVECSQDYFHLDLVGELVNMIHRSATTHVNNNHEFAHMAANGLVILCHCNPSVRKRVMMMDGTNSGIGSIVGAIQEYLDSHHRDYLMNIQLLQLQSICIQLGNVIYRQQ